ncbi:MAG: hypothetical protein K9M07_02180 [Simkaniaceae bacterium]|nr:hypothetical protein [Simkaniaceae bacterium]MCF7852030.1 hypothetical protein [Simkaniaceae bacterium]
MKTFLINFLVNNWPRKLIALILAIFIWFVVDNTLTTVKTLSNVNVRIINVPQGKTIEGIQSDGIMSKKITLTLTGKKTVLERLSSNDLEIVIDAANRTKNEWVTTITKTNIVSLNPDINLQKGVSKISLKNYIVKMSPLATVKVPVFITQPIGEAPRGYRFLDVWPYQLYLTVSGPESTVAKLKTRGVKLTFNLNDISKAELDNLQSSTTSKTKDVVSFFIPKEWKQIYLPSISEKPIQIDDPDANYLRIDFIRSELLPISNAIPLSLFSSPMTRSNANIQTMKFSGPLISTSPTQMPVLNLPLYAKGANDVFIEVVKNMMEIVVIYPPAENNKLNWSVQFINPKELEDRYVSIVLSDVSDKEIRELQPELRQKYLRNRFRNYMNRFQLFRSDDKLLELSFELNGNQIVVSEENGS